MLSRASATLTVGIVLSVLLTLIGYSWPSLWLVYAFKPLATLLLVAIAAYHWTNRRTSYSQWIAIGMAFCLIGDAFLIWPNEYFLEGLVAFLCAHVVYLVAFSRDSKFLANLLIWLFYLVFTAAIFLFLFPTLPPGLRIPVALYAALLSTMAAQAMGRALALNTTQAKCAAFGALLFMASDLLLAFHRFRTPLRHSAFLILVPYYLGQWLIASSASESRGEN